MRNLYFKYTPLLLGILSLFVTAGFHLIYIKGYFHNQLFWIGISLVNLLMGIAFGRHIMLLHRLGALDMLTGLYNRRYLYLHLDQEISSSKRKETTFSLAMIDIDNFKRLNDLKGHLEGDRVLKRVSAVIKKSIRATDFACRWGGEEFVVVLHNSNLEVAEAVLERIRKEVNLFAGVTISAGVVYCSDPQKIYVENLLNKADTALYQAKVNKNSIIALELVC